MGLLKITTPLQILAVEHQRASRPFVSPFIYPKSFTLLSLLKTLLNSSPTSLAVWELDLHFHCSECLYHLPRISTSLPSRQMSVFKLNIGPGACFGPRSGESSFSPRRESFVAQDDFKLTKWQRMALSF